MTIKKSKIIFWIIFILVIVFSIRRNFDIKINQSQIIKTKTIEASNLSGTVDVMNLPKLTEPVSDFTNTLTPEQLSGLITISKDFEAQTTNQVVVVLIPDRGGNELFDIGMKIFNTNHFGQKGKDNGVLLLIAVNEKKLRIVTGYGVESLLPDVLASDIIENHIRPEVNKGDIYQGISNYFTYTMQALDGNYTTSPKSSKDKIDPRELSFLILFICVWIYLMFFKKRGPGDSIGGWYGGSSGGGGGGRSGGGGDSGGGGAGD